MNSLHYIDINNTAYHRDMKISISSQPLLSLKSVHRPGWFVVLTEMFKPCIRHRNTTCSSKQVQH